MTTPRTSAPTTLASCGVVGALLWTRVAAYLVVASGSLAWSPRVQQYAVARAVQYLSLILPPEGGSDV